MIVATAGHVDHGKTLLIKTLTGVDTDRLEEEKRRGLTIDLGFAYLPIDGVSEPVGFIDVPGHEKFIRNMVCGVAGVDIALFVIAADDGVMPQSREHLAILDLLGVREGLVALTKVDRVTDERVREVSDEVVELLGATALANSPVFPVSAITGEGVQQLRDALGACAKKTAAHGTAGHFRLAVDRRFDITGAGLIVTGTVFAGAVSVGEQVRILARDGAFRVRSIRAQDTETDCAVAGQRAALNLAGPGLSRRIVGRGDWVVGSEAQQPVAKFDGRLRVLASEGRALVHWTPVHVHLGAAETTGRVALLDTKTVPPGGRALAQLVLDTAIGAHYGDGFIIRDQSATRTIGGGRVIDTFPPARRRGAAQRLAVLEALETADHDAALASHAAIASGGVALEQFTVARNLTQTEREAIVSRFEGRVVGQGGQARVFAPPRWEAMTASVTAVLGDWHRAHPEQVGPGDLPLLRAAGYRFDNATAQAVVTALAADGAVVREAMGVRLRSHTPGLQGADAALWERVATAIEADGLRPGSLADVAGQLQMASKQLQSFLVSAGRQRLVHRISNTRYITARQLGQLREIAVATAAADENGVIDVRAFRDASGIGRNMSIEVLEYFDKIGVTVRRGDLREIKASAGA